MPTFGLPVRGPLHPFGWQRPAGNTDMVITQTAAQHMSSQFHVAGPPALDIGDGDPDHDEILAPHAGTVAQALTFGSANLSIDFTEAGVKWRMVLAHNVLPHPVAVNQLVAPGQVVGHMGMTGATAIHLHIQIGRWNGLSYVWVDPEPLLLAGDEMQPIPPAKFKPLLNKQTSVILPGGATLRVDRFNNATALKLYPAGTAFTPLAQADDGDPSPVSTIWYGGLGGTDAGVVFGWLQESALGPLVDTTPAGYTEAQLIDAKRGAARIVANAADAVASKF